MKVLTLGTFDLFHHGHVELLHRCSRYGPTTVALNTDDFVTRYKGTAPVLSYPERSVVVNACKYVAAVRPNNGRDQRQLILDTRPDLIVIGSDWLDQDYPRQLGVTPRFFQEQRISLMFVPYTEGVSTTDLKQRIQGRPGRHLLRAAGEHETADEQSIQRKLEAARRGFSLVRNTGGRGGD